MNKYKEPVYASAYAKVRNFADAEDLTLLSFWLMLRSSACDKLPDEVRCDGLEIDGEFNYGHVPREKSLTDSPERTEEVARGHGN